MNLLAQGLHAIAATLWIGGIFFAFMALRPVAQEVLQPREQLHLWRAAYRKFFPTSMGAHKHSFSYGLLSALFQIRGFANSQPYLHLMHIIGLIMVGAFFYLYFSLYGRLCRLIDTEDISAASDTLKKMRPVIAANLFLGIVITAG